MASLPAQVVYVNPHTTHAHAHPHSHPPPHSSSSSFHPHPQSHSSHSNSHISQSQSHMHPPQYHHHQSPVQGQGQGYYAPERIHHAPPPPPPQSQSQHQSYAQERMHPGSHHSHPSQQQQHHHPYASDRERERERARLPSIKDLDFSFHQQQAQAQSQTQSQGQGPSQQQIQGGSPPAGAGVNAPVVSPTALQITPVRLSSGSGGGSGRRHSGWGDAPQPPSSSQPHPQSHSQHYQHHQGQQIAPTSGSKPPYGSVQAQTQAQYQQGQGGGPLTRKPRSEIGHGGRSSSGGMGAGNGGGVGMTSMSPVGRSPLVPPTYAHPYPQPSSGIPPGNINNGIGIGSGSSVGSSTSGSVSNSNNTNPGTGGMAGGPHSPYTAAFPSPNTPHHHLHTPLSQGQGHVVSHATGESGGGGYEYESYGGYASAGAPGYGAHPPPPPGTSHSQGHAPSEPWNNQGQGQPMAYHQSQSQPHHSQSHPQHHPQSQPPYARGVAGAGYGPGPGPSPVGEGEGSVAYAVGNAGAPGSARDRFLPRIQALCSQLHDFALRYSTTTVQPSKGEVEEMGHRAAEIVKLLEEYRAQARAEGAVASHPHAASASAGLPSPAPDDHERERAGPSTGGGGRAPKRPWEDVAAESDEDAFEPASASARHQTMLAKGADPSGSSTGMGKSFGGKDVEKARTAAEKDMALIRSKRATNAGMLGAGAPKGKYRKRSRATPPGKCHSCNIRETPEWRRGPDGARTLCNACGLHYAKLCRKRDKAASSDLPGQDRPMEIDMETLRASTRAANEREAIKVEREREREVQRSLAESGSGSPSSAGAGVGGASGKAPEMVFRIESGLPAGKPSMAPVNSAAEGAVSAGLDGWRPYAEEHSSFLRGAPVPAPALVRPAST